MNVCSRSAQEELYDLLLADPEGVRTVLSVIVSFSDTMDTQGLHKLFEHDENSLFHPRLEIIEETSKTHLISGLWQTTFPILAKLAETCQVFRVRTQDEGWEEIGWTKPLQIPLSGALRLFLKFFGITPFSVRMILRQSLRATERSARREMDAYHRREQQALRQGDLLDYPPPPDAYELARLRRHAELTHEAKQIKNCRERISQKASVLWEASYLGNKTSLLILVKNTRTLPGIL